MNDPNSIRQWLNNDDVLTNRQWQAMTPALTGTVNDPTATATDPAGNISLPGTGSCQWWMVLTIRQ
ncbi:hypothetical protein C6N19_20455 [Acinetobacter pittii]|nr:hypothetical protein C6N19_20455 [Acinetobacter pittii]